MREQNYIEIKNVTKFYENSENPAVDNISLSIGGDEIFGLLGPNGAGKTTTISMLCGIFPPSSGKISINGKDINKNLSGIKKFIGVVPQDIALYPTLTAFENLEFFGKMYGLRGNILRKRIDECIEMLDLGKSRNKRISTFSGGMKRRINLVAGMLHEPDILFLDEPTVGIDVQSRKIIIERLLEINKNGTTIIYTSHHLQEAEDFCTDVAIIDYGKILLRGKPSDMIKADSDNNSLETIFLKLTGRHARD